MSVEAASISSDVIIIDNDDDVIIIEDDNEKPVHNLGVNKSRTNNKYDRTVKLQKITETDHTIIMTKTVKTTKKKIYKEKKSSKQYIDANKYKRTRKSCKIIKESNTIIRNKVWRKVNSEIYRERIVPCCLRKKCEKFIYSSKFKNYEQQKAKSRDSNKVNSSRYKTFSRVSSPLKDKSKKMEYDSISSESLISDYEDIDTLIKSTKKRLKHFEKSHQRPPAADKSTTVCDSKMHRSIHSLDTLVLTSESDDAYSPTMSPVYYMDTAEAIDDYYFNNNVNSVITNRNDNNYDPYLMASTPITEQIYAPVMSSDDFIYSEAINYFYDNNIIANVNNDNVNSNAFNPYILHPNDNMGLITSTYFSNHFLHAAEIDSYSNNINKYIPYVFDPNTPKQTVEGIMYSPVSSVHSTDT